LSFACCATCNKEDEYTDINAGDQVHDLTKLMKQTSPLEERHADEELQKMPYGTNQSEPQDHPSIYDAIPAPEPRKEEAAAKAPIGSKSFTISVEKTTKADKVGLNVRWTADSTALEVKSVKEGLVLDYNNSDAGQKEPVCTGDHITEVNGLTEDTSKMLDAVASSSKLTMTFSRPN